MPPFRIPSRLLTPRASPFLLNTRSNRILPLCRRTYASDHSQGDHGHESHYDPPGGWLWGIRPGEKYEKEGWEGLFWYGIVGSWVVAVGLYVMKEDTS